MTLKDRNRYRYSGQRGIAALELALILPLMVVMALAAVEFGRLIQARLVLTNLSREGADLVSRDIQSASQVITMLQDGSSPLDVKNAGRIYVTTIKAGTCASACATPEPYVDTQNSTYAGALSIPSSVGTGGTLGLSGALYQHLEFNPANQSADISQVTIVEVFYQFTPITPLSTFVNNLLPGGGSTILSSKAVF